MELSDIIKTFPDYQQSFYNQKKNEKEDEYTMYILINKTLPMQKGKIASQVGHAVQKITEYCLIYQPEIYQKYCQNNYAKIVLKVTNKETFLEILNQTIHLHKSYVVDEGRTQIKPNSLTAVGFIPIKKKDVPKCFQNLKLL